ncbi:myeloid-associated differentiation marker-like [Capricornis sumatraensis]|uniref:myeloid-associated differentiation marker-like n=1 Tax=Capricornis sumatraensis TaxID=34865 RepID=UPI0036044A26
MCCLLHLPQLFCTCMAFSLVVDKGILRGAVGNWSMSIWRFCLAMTLIVSIVELCKLQSRFPFFWYNLPVIYACYTALLCLLAFIIYATTHVHFLPYGPYWDRAIKATAFSCVASVLYATEVACLWQYYELSEIPCYVHTMPGLLKVLDAFVACLIFAFLSHTSLYLHQPALEWCVAVYSICFFPATLTILGNLAEWKYRLPVTFPIFQFLLTLLSVLLYVSTLVPWLLYQFNEKLGGKPQRSSDEDCIDGFTAYLCTWDQHLIVAVLTASNLLVYVAGLVYWAHQLSVGTKGLHSTPDSLHSWEVSSPSSDIL